MLCIETSCAGLNPRPKSGNESSFAGELSIYDGNESGSAGELSIYDGNESSSAGELSIYDGNESSSAGELSKEKELYFFEVKKRNNP